MLNYLKVKYHHILPFAPALVIQSWVEILIVLENVPKTACISSTVVRENTDTAHGYCMHVIRVFGTHASKYQSSICATKPHAKS
jgi:hypothetical protein